MSYEASSFVQCWKEKSNERCGILILMLSTSSPCCAIAVGLWVSCCNLSVVCLVSMDRFRLPWVPATCHCQVQLGLIFSRSHRPPYKFYWNCFPLKHAFFFFFQWQNICFTLDTVPQTSLEEAKSEWEWPLLNNKYRWLEFLTWQVYKSF